MDAMVLSAVICLAACPYLLWRNDALVSVELRVLRWDSERARAEIDRVYRERLAAVGQRHWPHDLPEYPALQYPHVDALPPHWVMLAQVWRRPSSYLPKEMHA